jgi:hypothetical protein
MSGMLGRKMPFQTARLCLVMLDVRTTLSEALRMASLGRLRGFLLLVRARRRGGVISIHGVLRLGRCRLVQQAVCVRDLTVKINLSQVSSSRSVLSSAALGSGHRGM